MQIAILKFLFLLPLLLAQLMLSALTPVLMASALILMPVSMASAQTRMPGTPNVRCFESPGLTGPIYIPTHIACTFGCRCSVGASYIPDGDFQRWKCPDSDLPTTKTLSQCKAQILAENPDACDDGRHLCQAVPPPPVVMTMTMTVPTVEMTMTMTMTVERPASSSSGGGGSSGALIAGGAVLAGIVLWNAFAPELPDGAEFRPSANVAYRDGFARPNFGLYAAYGDWSAVVSSSHAGQGWTKPYARIRWEWAWEF